MTRVAQLALRVAKWTALAGVAFLAGAIIINLFDESPSADVAALAVVPRVVPDRDNAYLALLGIDAPPGVRPVDEGRRMVDDHEREVARPMAERASEFLKALESESKYRAANPRPPPFPFCEAPAEPCMRTSIARGPALLARLEADETLVDRYRRTLQLPAFEEIATQDLYTMMHPWQYWQPRKLLVQKAALDAQQGRLADAVHFLTDDLRFWASVIEGGPSLTVVMLAARAAREDLAVLSEIIAEPGIDIRPYAESIVSATTPSPHLGRGFARTLAREFQMTQRFHNDIFVDAFPERVTWVERARNHVEARALKSNATRNRVAELYTRLQASVNRLPATCADIVRFPEQVQRFGKWNIDWLYNPIGKRIVAMGAYQFYDSFALRVCDVIVHMALVRAQLGIRLASTSDVVNPYTGRPFDWAEGARELSFMQKGPLRRDDAGPVRASVPSQRN